ncbi:hypothetical protein CVT24_010868 [Panaeolus cyanescens]|uniref:PIN domain-containing protein n=1 Tax=Panaeolus cyanescens TaxID=181874 RepID=A0A409YYD6_9AGAR|nr:hypothetical protein CVT24_010868 [Panaeolus cyanescens]
MQVESYPIDSKPSRKGKERDALLRDSNLKEGGPQPTDIDEKLTALRRRNAAMTRPRDKSERERMHPSQPTLPSSSATSQQQQPAASSSSLQRLERPERSPKLSVPSSAARQPPPSPRRHASPHVIVSRPTQDADHEDFSRRLKISTSPSPRPSSSTQKPSASQKLFNPNTDPIPMRRTAEPEQSPDADTPQATRNSHSHHREDRGSSRQLFDHRKDDPVRFSVLTRPQLSQGGRPTPVSKPSADYVSASSTSSYAASVASSSFTLSSTTDGSSASSALFDQRPGQTDESGNNAFSIQLKKLYRGITSLEAKVQKEDAEEGEEALTARVMLKGKELEQDDIEKEKWKKRISDHKQLAELIHTLLTISLAPSVPASLRNIPTKYNIIVRLWTFGFHKLLESLRHSSFTSPLALEHLQDVIYYAYTFYTGLLEEPTLNPFKAGWLEALGDLARYRMAVAAMVNGGIGGQGGLTQKAVTEASNGTDGVSERPTSNGSVKSISDAPAARIDDSPSPSIGLAAARLLDVEPEKERWRNIARDWYGTGLTDQPGTGKLHHHLGLLSREAEGEELRAVYHFVKSMTTLHPFPTSRESILPIWAPALQAKRSLPDARASDLFVRLHGMLFTNIQLDDFQPTLSRFIERLEIEGAEERDWIMMGITNIASVFEYGRPNGLLRRVGCVGIKEANGQQAAAAMRVMAKKAAAGVPGSVNPEERMDVDQDQNGDATMKSPTIPSAESQLDANAQPLALKCALQLTFAMLSYVLSNPERRASQFSTFTLNPYLPIVLTFLATVLKHKPTLDILERSIPWAELAHFFTKVPRKIMISQGLMPHPATLGKSHRSPSERWIMLTSGCQPPLPEDWCMRGMEWVGRKVFERGFWKSGEERRAELEVLQAVEGTDLTDGTIEDDDDGQDEDSKKGMSDLTRRWIRIVRCGVQLADAIDGFGWTDGTREWRVEGKLKQKVETWSEEDRLEREEEERRRMGRRWGDDAMDIDEDNSASDEESEDDETDSPEIRELKERRRELRRLIQAQSTIAAQTSRRPRGAASRPLLPIVPGYTVLVIDTNILLSALSIFSSFIESFRWTVIVPLPVIMELEGLSKDTNTIGEAAKSAMGYISSHIRSHALSLKVQTSRGNYLTSLNVRTEQVDFSDKSSAEQTMDDLILKAAFWHEDHWVDRSSMLKAPVVATTDLQNAVKVVLLSFDRNMRLKARSRQLPTASEKDLASILSKTTT